MENYRIVCLVNNDEKNHSSGLPLAFGHNNRSKLNQFIKENLYYFNEDGEFKTHFGSGEKKKKFILITDNGIKTPGSITSELEWDVLFVTDDYNTDIRNFPEDIFNEDTLLMYHTTPSIGDGPISQIKARGGTKKIKKGKKGWHTYDKYGGYTRLFDLTEAWEQNENGEYKFTEQKYKAAIKSIIDWFDLNAKLNAALEFLHKSLGGTPASIDILTSNDDAFDLKKEVHGKTLQKWIDGLMGKTGVEYNKDLAYVRDALLDIALKD